MRQFCNDVLKFLESEYDDSYRFEIECARSLWHEKVELSIIINPRFRLTLENEYMRYLFGCYRAGEFIEERNQYRWQKELVDMIEGG